MGHGAVPTRDDLLDAGIYSQQCKVSVVKRYWLE